MIHTVNDIIEINKQILADLDKLNNFISLSNVLRDYSLTENDIENIYENEIKDNLSEEQQNKLLSCSEHKDEELITICKENIKKQFVEEYLDDINNFIEFIKSKDQSF
jgi:hypothetical protein